MSQCQSCVHWVPFDGGRDDYHAGRLIRANRLGLCRKISDAANRDHELPDDMRSNGELVPNPPDGTIALCIDGSDYVHDMRTAATFGCVLWEPKGTVQADG
jgi:hypothetical protein